jgi:hypothetical protein
MAPDLDEPTDRAVKRLSEDLAGRTWTSLTASPVGFYLRRGNEAVCGYLKGVGDSLEARSPTRCCPVSTVIENRTLTVSRDTACRPTLSSNRHELQTSTRLCVERRGAPGGAT